MASSRPAHPAVPPLPAPSGDPPQAVAYLYDAAGIEERRCGLGAIEELLRDARASGRRLWIDIESPDRTAVAAALERQLALHPLSVDVLQIGRAHV